MNSLDIRSIRKIATAFCDALLVGSTFLCGTALAQDKEVAILEEIVVTASKRGETSAQNIAGAITAFDAKKLDRLNAVDFDELIVHVPSTNYIDNGGPGRGHEVASIRGLSRVSDTSDVVVSQYLDGAPRFGSNYRLFDIGEVAVLRGPQGTLWGSQSVGGVIAYRSNRPNPGEFSGRLVSDLYTTDDDGGMSTRIAGSLNIPLIEDKLAVRIAAQVIDESGYVDNVTVGKDDVNKVDEAAWRASIAWRPSEKSTLSLIYHGNDLSAAAPSFFSLSLPGYQSEDARNVSTADQKYDLLIAEGEFDLGWAALTYNGSFFDMDNVWGQWKPAFLGDDPGVENTITHQKSATHELRLVSTSDSSLQWIAGFFYDDLEQDQINNYVPDSTGSQIFTFGGPTDTRHTALFGEVSYDFGERWSVLAGIRFYEWQVDAIPVFTFFDSDFSNAPGSEKDNDQLYKFQVNYDINDGLFVYGVVSQGFRTGGFNAGVNPAVGFPDEFSRWSPDHLTNYELGLKTVLSDGRIQFNSAVYIMQWDDVISVVANEAGNFFINANVPDLEASGFETEVVTKDLFGVGFYAAATFSYTKNEFKSDAAIFDGAPTNIRQGDELRRTPKNTWSFNLGYDFTLANTDAYIRANYWHRSSTSTRGFDGGDGDIKVPAHDVMNMSAGMNWQSWALKFYVNNVTNERPFLQIFPNSVDSTLPAVASSIRPRTVGLEVSFGSHD